MAVKGSEHEDVSHILEAVGGGDVHAANELLPLVYNELKRLAAQRIAHDSDPSIQATVLVHEAYLRLVGGKGDRSFNDSGHFYAAAANAMRRIMIDRARDRRRLKRGGGAKRQAYSLDQLLAEETPAEDVLALDEAISKLAREHPAAAELVKLRVFAGLSHGEAAESLGLPRRSADRIWAYARAWLFDALNPS